MDLHNEFIKIISSEGGILHLTLNRPEQLNALNEELLHQLSVILAEAKHNSAIKALLITGEGKAFCAGADIKQLNKVTGHDAVTFAKKGQAVFRKLELLGKPSLAAIRGVALGGGCELAMACTLRIASESAVFGQPEIKLGVIPGYGGTQRLSRLIGKGRALDICLTGRRFSAHDAYQWGFLNELTTEENLLTRAFELLRNISLFSPIAVQAILACVHHGYDLSLEEALEMEAAYFGVCCNTADKQEGITAFLEKRAPVFHGE